MTCHHVLKAFRGGRPLGGQGFFQFGPIRFDPENHLLSEDESADLATFDLTQYLDLPGNGIERAKCIEPTAWPPRQVESDDVLALAGFPGIWRNQIDVGHLQFYSFSSGATGVDARGDRHLVTRIQIQQCLVDINRGLVTGSLGGLSGGPVFAWRKSPVLFAELVGFIIEYQEALDLMYIRRASCMNEAGQLV